MTLFHWLVYMVFVRKDPREKNNKASNACGFALSVVMKSRGLSLARKSGQTPGSKSAQDARQLLFIAGVGLIASSFLVYPAYPLIILYLPFAGHVKFTVIVTAWILSWVIFGVGILLAGWEGYEIIKRPLNRRSVRKKRDALNALNHRDEPRSRSPQ